MSPTPYPTVNAILGDLQNGIEGVLGDKLVGLALYGSLVTGEFSPDLSDIDLAAFLATDLDETELNRLEGMHAAIAAAYPVWDDRIEVGYISTKLLRSFDPAGIIAVISPGEPFHLRRAEASWLFNLAVLRDGGISLLGPPPHTLIPPIAPEALGRALCGAMQMWRAWLPDADRVMNPKSQAYITLTMCRALYTKLRGTSVSKRAAAHWAMTQFPDWSQLIEEALTWYEARQEPAVDLAATRAATLRFADFATNCVLNGDVPGRYR
ncbi:MAG: DUF4111 domain-containing protein [Chloroflexota bacterium]|nr:DUF4111 domain-containing protein [Chloroflexota bacterium]